MARNVVLRTNSTVVMSVYKQPHYPPDDRDVLNKERNAISLAGFVVEASVTQLNEVIAPCVDGCLCTLALPMLNGVITLACRIPEGLIEVRFAAHLMLTNYKMSVRDHWSFNSMVSAHYLWRTAEIMHHCEVLARHRAYRLSHGIDIGPYEAARVYINACLDLDVLQTSTPANSPLADLDRGPLLLLCLSSWIPTAELGLR